MKTVSVQIGIGHPFSVSEDDVPKLSALLELFEERTQGCSCGSSCARCAEPEDTQPETQSGLPSVVDAAGVAHGYTDEDDDEPVLVASVSDVLTLRDQLGGKTGPVAGALSRVLRDYEELLDFYRKKANWTP